jgi:hypothetical protein
MNKDQYKYLSVFLALACLGIFFISALKLSEQEQRLFQVITENENLNYQFTQCKILYRGMPWQRSYYLLYYY